MGLPVDCQQGVKREKGGIEYHVTICRIRGVTLEFLLFLVVLTTSEPTRQIDATAPVRVPLILPRDNTSWVCMICLVNRDSTRANKFFALNDPLTGQIIASHQFFGV